jgi:DNA invertase Pin-like site-specific DNA recombinase
MMTAIYARKSTEQHGLADEQKSVTRQIEHARAYAIRKGWTVNDGGIFVDDGISGAEFAARPGFVRLMNALKPRPAFQVLVMSEESRLGREAIETAYALKQLVQAGVRVFFYMEDRERTLDSPTDKIMLSLTAYADELEREKARQRTYDAMIRKARAGHVTGGRVFGYDNVDVLGPDGKRSYVVRTVNEPEAAVIRRIFEWSAAGLGLTGITKRLNEAGALAPRPQQGRPTAWVSSSVRAVLRRPLYRGEILWNQTRKRDGWGQANRRHRAVEEWLRVPVPALQIVSPELCHAADCARATREAQYAVGGRSHRSSSYLLSGFARCAQCGGGFASHSRSHGKQRVLFYACTSHWKRGPVVCRNGLVGRMDAIDAEVLATLETDILRPSVVERAIRLALDALKPERQHKAHEKLVRAVEQARAECDRLADAIQRGGPMDVLIDRLRAAQTRRLELEAQLTASQTSARPVVAGDLEGRLRRKLADWRGLLTRNVETGREVLRVLLVGPLRFTPIVEARRRAYAFDGAIALERLVSGVIDLPTLTRVASPTGFEPVFWP